MTKRRAASLRLRWPRLDTRGQAAGVRGAHFPAFACTERVDRAERIDRAERGGRGHPGRVDQDFNERCALCHGAHGKGDGPGGMGMKPPPRNWTDPAWQASVTDEHIATALVKGGVAIGESPTMPPSPDLEPKKATVAGSSRSSARSASPADGDGACADARRLHHGKSRAPGSPRGAP